MRPHSRLSRSIGDGDRLGDVHHEAGLAHRRACGEDDQVLVLEARRELVEAVVAGGNASDQLSGVLELLDRLHVLARDAIERHESFVDASFGDLVERLFGDVQHIGRLARRVECGAHDGVPHNDEPPQHRLFFDDARIALDVGHVRNAVGE